MFPFEDNEQEEMKIILENSKTLFKQTVTILLKLEFPSKYKDEQIFEEDEVSENEEENKENNKENNLNSQNSIDMVNQI
jgi:hypothetical protein